MVWPHEALLQRLRFGKWSSGMDRLRLMVRNSFSYFGTAGLQALEELVDVLPDFGSAGEAAPVHADQADQTEALVDGNNVVLVGSSDAIDEEGLNVGLHRLQRGMLRGYLGPGFEAQERLDGSRGAGIHGHHPAACSVVVEEGQVDGDHEGFPLQVRHLEIGESAD